MKNVEEISLPDVAMPEQVNEAAITAAMKEGNKHGVKSTVAAHIVAAYIAAQPAEGIAQVAKLHSATEAARLAGKRVIALEDEIALLKAKLAAPERSDTPANAIWQKFGDHTRFHAHRRFDVVLTNGVTEYDREHQQVDWTQVADWRYASDKQGAQGDA